MREAESDYAQVDLAKLNQVDPFSKDKVIKLESSDVTPTRPSAEAIRYGDEIMAAIELADAWREEVEQYRAGLEVFNQSK